ncbi:MAG: YiiD C-terminal domain-containing protein [Gammaproteobacteria bacterium]|nr:YiiD C-terminal domain-containing protein [Gammaproteobacteria bacterium]
MSPAELERYLHEHIPVTRAIGVGVASVGEDRVVLRAPLAPNVNHRDTVFGGSASALAILAAWSLVHTRLTSAGIVCRLVIQRNAMEYDAPITGDFTARSALAEPQQWSRFTRALQRRGKARVAVSAVLEQADRVVGRFTGEFVALASAADRARRRP